MTKSLEVVFEEWNERSDGDLRWIKDIILSEHKKDAFNGNRPIVTIRDNEEE